MPKGEMIQKLF